MPVVPRLTPRRGWRMLRAMALWRALVIVVGAATSTACRDASLTQLEGVRDEVCQCKTASCAEGAMQRVPAGEVKNNHRAQVIAREMTDCLAKLYEAERPATGPDVDVPAPAPAPGP